MKNKPISTAEEVAVSKSKALQNTERPIIRRERMPAVQSEPRVYSREGIRFVRAEWLVVLLPICLWSLLRFGAYALVIELVAIVACMGTDIAVKIIRSFKDKSPVYGWDLTPAVIGVLIAFLLPSDLPVWIAVLAALIAAGVGGLFGSMSRSPLCLPALAVIAVRMIFSSYTDIPLLIDSENGRTIADMLAAGEQPSAGIADLLLGRTDSMIGEGAVLLILLAAGYLVYRKQISWHIPIAWIVGGALAAYLTAPETMPFYVYMGAQLFTGGFMLVGCLILPHRTTAPVTPRAGLVIGAIGGALTILLRGWLGVDGALLAALLCSLPARPLDRLLAPVPFGGRKK